MGHRKSLSGLPERLKKCRKNVGLTLEEAAVRADSSRSSISGYENGSRQPSLYTLARLSVIYGVSSDYLLGLDKKNPYDFLDISGIPYEQKDIIIQLIKSLKVNNGH